MRPADAREENVIDRTRIHRAPLVALAAVLLLAATDAGAYRMIRNASIGRVSSGASVTCGDALGFAHWPTSSISWRLNPASQGSKAGMENAFKNALAAWNGVTPAPYTLSYAGTTNQGFATDGVNTVAWGTGNGCVGSCLAFTALVLAAGQVITETDFVMNDAVNWSAGGGGYDAQAIMAHELGHSLGIHHTDVKQKHNRPTMYAYYFGSDGRTLSSDDQAALNCAYSRYPPRAAGTREGGVTDHVADEPAAVSLASRARATGTNLRFALASGGAMTLEVYDVAGRHLATLVDEWRAAGEHEVAWNGDTRFGNAPRGVYFARARTAAGTATATIVLTR
jgi:hypothetical protein